MNLKEVYQEWLRELTRVYLLKYKQVGWANGLETW